MNGEKISLLERVFPQCPDHDFPTGHTYVENRWYHLLIHRSDKLQMETNQPAMVLTHVEEEEEEENLSCPTMAQDQF